MSDTDSGRGRSRRSVGLVLGGLATGTLLGTAIGAEPARADTAPSIRQQFDSGYTPGRLDLTSESHTGIVVTRD